MSNMSLHTLIIRYSAFASIATVANLLTQRMVFSGGTSSWHFMVAVAAGTLVGLVIKYVLDKRWIFYDCSSGTRHHGRKFTLYTAMGLVTTAIFWGTESAFWFIWQTEAMREIGATLGLALGYIVKYNLDRRFVFVDSQLRMYP